MPRITTVRKIIRDVFKPGLQFVLGNRHLIYRLPARDNVVALTFDDGPDPAFTPRVLKILRDNGIMATFFLIGNKVIERTDLAREILQAGHAIGTHSLSHEGYRNGNAKTMIGEIARTQEIFRSLLGFESRYFRPPGGQVNLEPLVYCASRGIQTISFNIDCRDSYYNTAAQMQAWYSTIRFRRGDIVLLHDDNTPALDTLQFLIDRIKSQGFRFATVGDIR